MQETEYTDLIVTDKLKKILWEPKDYKIFFGGRSASKTWNIGQELAVRGDQNPLRILCAREIQKSYRRSLLPLLTDTIKRCGLDDVYDITKLTEITHPNGTEFFFEGLKFNIENILGIEGIDILWVEEGRNITEQTLNILFPTIRKAGSEIWISFNPMYETDPVYKRFVAPYLDQLHANDGVYEDDDIHVVWVNYKDNPRLPERSRKDMERDKNHDYEKYEHVWKGKCLKRSKEQVFKKWREGIIDVPEKANWYYGCDFGFSGTPLVLLRCYCDDDKRLLYFDYAEYGLNIEVDKHPEFFDKVPGSKDWQIYADSARPELISYMRRRGYKIKKAKKGPGSVEEGVKFLQSYDIVIHPRCKELKYNFANYKFKLDDAGEVTPILIKKNDDGPDAARYALEKLAFNKSRFNI